MYFTLIVVIISLSNCVVFGDNSELKFKVTLNEANGYVCEVERSKYNLLENSPFNVSCQHPNYINYIMCVPAFNRLDRISDRNGLQIFTITDWSPAAEWKCKLLSNKGNGEYFQTNTYISTDNQNVSYAVANCVVSIHTRLLHAPQNIYINSIKQTPTILPLSEEKFDAEIVHFYEDGDTVKVKCVNPKGEYSLRLTYDYFDRVNVTDKIFPSKFMTNRPTSLRLRLKADLNNTYAVCKCYLEEDTYFVKITFVMRENIRTNIIDTQINGLTMRTENDTQKNYTYEYRYNLGETIDMRCLNRKTGQYIIPRMSNQNHLLSTQKNEEGSGTIIPYTEKNPDYTYTCKKDNDSRKVHFKKDELSSNIRCAARFAVLNVRDNAMTIIHEDNKMIKVLYEDGDSFNITCSGYCKSGTIYSVKLNGSTNKTSSKLYNVMATEQKQYDCEIIETTGPDESRTVDNLKLSFVAFQPEAHKDVQATTMSSVVTSSDMATDTIHHYEDLHDSEFPPWLMAVVAGIACLFLICVCCIYYKRRKRGKENGTTTVVGYVPQVNCPTEPRSAPEVTYAQPHDQLEEPRYTVPYKPELYATPIPKSQRPGNTEYASIQNEVYAEFKNLYSKVLPKSQRKVKESYDYVEVEPNSAGKSDLYDYAEIGAKTVGKPKYVNVFKGPYKNADGEHNYAEPH